ncbi:MAG: zinc ribbon domain-containing protein [Clostridia bacterium]|nr:zinc ribbon domain-containing protein [Clostridia bacterium]
MKYCPKCNAACDDNAAFCTTCGFNFAAAPQAAPQMPQRPAAPQAAPGYNPAPAAPAYDPYDHTAKFDAKDVADNKPTALLVYLTGFVGIIIALLSGKSSAYLSFHTRQGIKFAVVEAFLAFCSMIYSKVIFGLIDGIISNYGIFGIYNLDGIRITRFAFSLISAAIIICLVIVWIVKLITFFGVCKGKSKEPAIIRGFRFMK